MPKIWWYCMIPNVVMYDGGLTPNQKLLYGIISSLCAKRWFCWATNEYLWEKQNVSQWTASNNIKRLCECWYISVDWEGQKRKIILTSLVQGDNNPQLDEIDRDDLLEEWLDIEIKTDETCNKTNVTKKIDKPQNKEWLKKYWQYVELTDEEYKKLIYMFGSCSWICNWVEAHLKLNSKTVDDKIEDMNNYIINWKWKPYADYYLALRNRFKRDWKMPYWERGSLEDMKAYLEKENSWQLYYRAFTEFYDKVEEIRDTLWKINVDRDLEFFDTHKWHFFLDY